MFILHCSFPRLSYCTNPNFAARQDKQCRDSYPLPKFHTVVSKIVSLMKKLTFLELRAPRERASQQSAQPALSEMLCRVETEQRSSTALGQVVNSSAFNSTPEENPHQM